MILMAHTVNVSSCPLRLFIVQRMQGFESHVRVQDRVLVAPYLVVGGTDSKHYAPLTRNIYRFQPMSIDRRGGDLQRIHGTDERISLHDLEVACSFFLRLIDLACSS